MTPCLLMGGLTLGDGVILFLPTFVPLIGGSFLLASNRAQRLMNMIAGFVFALIGAASVPFLVHAPPNSWADANYGLITFAFAPIGAVVGIGLAASFRGALRQARSRFRTARADI